MSKFLLKVFFAFFFIQLNVMAFEIEENSKINLQWFENFNDKTLLNYIIEGLDNNFDSKIAKLNILKSREEKNIAISREFPNLNVGASYLLLKVPNLAIPNNDLQTNSFALPFLSFWEMDYLGKNYNKIQKQKLDIKNSNADLKAANLIIMTDIASCYFNLSYINSKIKLEKEVKNDYLEILKRKQKLFDYGIISITELNSSREEVVYQENILNDLLKLKEIFSTEFMVLLGKSPLLKDEIKLNPFELIEFEGDRIESLNGSVIQNRPDIIKLENEIKKAKIDITISKKEFLPSINLFGVMIFSTIVQNFGWDGVLAALSVGAVQNIFDGGKKIFNLKKAKIKYDISVQNYLKMNLQALKEVNDALYTYKKDYETFENNKVRAKIADDNLKNTLNSYIEGEISRIDYIEENVKKIKSEDELLKSKNQNFINLLSLFKVTGGAL